MQLDRRAASTQHTGPVPTAHRRIGSAGARAAAERAQAACCCTLSLAARALLHTAGVAWCAAGSSGSGGRTEHRGGRTSSLAQPPPHALPLAPHHPLHPRTMKLSLAFVTALAAAAGVEAGVHK